MLKKAGTTKGQRNRPSLSLEGFFVRLNCGVTRFLLGRATGAGILEKFRPIGFFWRNLFEFYS